MPSFEDADVYRILEIAVRTERLLQREFEGLPVPEVVAGLFLHAVVCARSDERRPVREQLELVRILNEIALTCEEQTDPIALAIVQKDPVRLLNMLALVADTDQQLNALLKRAYTGEEKK